MTTMDACTCWIDASMPAMLCVKCMDQLAAQPFSVHACLQELQDPIGWMAVYKVLKHEMQGVPLPDFKGGKKAWYSDATFSTMGTGTEARAAVKTLREAFKSAEFDTGMHPVHTG